MYRAHRVRLSARKERRDLRARKAWWVLRERPAARPAHKEPRATTERPVRVARKVQQEEAAHKAPEDLKGLQGSRGLKVCKECPDLRERREKLALRDCRDSRAKTAHRDSILTRHQPRVWRLALVQRASWSVVGLLIR